MTLIGRLPFIEALFSATYVRRLSLARLASGGSHQFDLCSAALISAALFSAALCSAAFFNPFGASPLTISVREMLPLA